MTVSELRPKGIAGQVCVWKVAQDMAHPPMYVENIAHPPTKLNIIACIVPHVDANLRTVGEEASQTLHVNC